MNRSIDSRSDLYSLGVTLYEMFTGCAAVCGHRSDGLGSLPHRQAGRSRPVSGCSGLPEPLSAIVMKLLAKTAEERYQTAAGVEADLRRCSQWWKSHGRIDSFRWARRRSDRLLIPEKLYGREHEIDTLLAVLRPRRQRGQTGTRARVRLLGYWQILRCQ